MEAVREGGRVSRQAPAQRSTNPEKQQLQRLQLCNLLPLPCIKTRMGSPPINLGSELAHMHDSNAIEKRAEAPRRVE